MRSIVSAEFTNFQAHRHILVEFSNYTGIVGATDKGKTSIVRGIVWVLYNTPSGTNFITRGETYCEGVVTFSDGLVIKRARGSKENYYEITYPNGETMHLEGFGVGSCDEVTRAHGMREIDFINGKDILNICKQLSVPFFIGESPTVQALIIGLLGKTDVVDLAIKNTASDARAAKLEGKKYKEDLKEIKSELSELKGLGMMEKAIDFASKNLEKIEYINAKADNINSLVSELGSLNGKRESAIEILKSSDDIMACDDIIGEAIEVVNRLTAIKKLSLNLEEQINKYDKAKTITDKVSEEEVNELIENIDEIISISHTLSDIHLKSRRLKELVSYRKQFESLPNEDEIDSMANDIEKAIDILKSLSRISPVNDKLRMSIERKARGEKLINQLSMEYDEAVSDYKDGIKEHDICPICNHEMDADNIEI